MTARRKDALFPTTDWRILNAIKVDRKSELWNNFVRRYHDPVFRLIHKYVYSEKDSEDLTQVVFGTIYSRNSLKALTPSKGQFRSFIMAATINVIKEHVRFNKAKKRGGVSEILLSEFFPLDQGGVSNIKSKSIPDVEREFDRNWVENLINLSARQLHDECKRSGTDHYEIVSLKFFEGRSNEKIAEELSISPVEMDNRIRAAVRHFKHYFMMIVLSYCGDDKAEFRREMRRLEGVIFDIAGIRFGGI